ncbi:hypothetical protein Scep_029355 [Stephania cephalantha]|uniref:Protein kinase domain-containing protein n=1 Tax=Stephania cephalantha TaxID=152367 RepID=A0AAP0E561_9MAGN
MEKQEQMHRDKMERQEENREMQDRLARMEALLMQHLGIRPHVPPTPRTPLSPVTERSGPQSDDQPGHLTADITPSQSAHLDDHHWTLTDPYRRMHEDRHHLLDDHDDQEQQQEHEEGFGADWGRVAAVETDDEWELDHSKLLVGVRFACGAHSRVHHGMYMDNPVAVKITRAPPTDGDENGAMAARLEKQFNREVSLLSQLHHQNIIKLVAATCKKPPDIFVVTEYLSGGSLTAFLHKLEKKPLLFIN